MATASPFSNTKKDLRFPKLGPFYDNFAQPLAWAALRFVVGAALVIQAIPLIKDPLSLTGFFDGIGFHPGYVWSPVLMVVQVLGGILIALGLYTRPAAFAVGIMLLVTLWYHLTYPFNPVLITQDGLRALSASSGMMTQEGYALLRDGGRSFSRLAQEKSLLTSVLWAGTAFLFAAFGGGYLSLDRKLMRKRF